MNPFLSKELADEHIRDLRAGIARGGRGRGGEAFEETGSSASVSVRGFAERDIDAVRYLAALDGKRVPTGGVLVAEVGGEIVAALPLDGGPALADPFKPTRDVVALLQLRARQLHESTETRRPLLSLPARLRTPVRKLA